MGLLEIVFIFTGIYWISYFISLFITSSEDYKGIKIPLRITLGFIYFSFANAIFFKVFSIQLSVCLGILLLVGISYIKNKNFIKDSFQYFKESYRHTIFYFLFYLFLLNVFILPMHIAGHYTAFTEKGGDITIYSDVSKLLIDKKEPAFGLEDGIEDLISFITKPSDMKNSMTLFNFNGYRDVKILDPPYAEYGAYRIAANRWYASSQLVLNSQWFFLSENSTFLFYMVLAFIYSSTIALVFCFAFEKGMVVGILTVCLLFFSPSFISIFYNLYLMHVFSVMCIILSFSLIQKVNFKSINIHSDLFLVLLFLFSSYYMSVFIIILPYFIFILSNAKDIHFYDFSFKRGFNNAQKIILTTILLILLSWIFIDLLGTSLRKVISFIFQQLNETAEEKRFSKVFYGDAIPILSQKWFSFFSGLRSQDHYPPFIPSIPLIEKVSQINLISFFLLIILSFINFIRSIIRGRTSYQTIIYTSSIVFTIILYAFISQNYLYMQSKSAQYNLIPLYFAIFLLNKDSIGIEYKFLGDKIIQFILLILIVLQIILFSIPRYYFLRNVAYSMNLSCVMEESFYEQTKNIDKDSFTLIELEKPGCIYFITQPFFGKKMVSTKHLALQKLNAVFKDGSYYYEQMGDKGGLNASDFVDVDELADRIIYLYPEKIIKTEVKDLGVKTEVEWGKKKMGEIKSPELILTADLFEKNFRTVVTDGKTKRIHYSRNGAGLLFFPESQKEQVVTLEYKNAREETKTTIKSENLKFKAKSKYVESINFLENPKYLQVKIQLKESKSPFLLHLPALDQEYLISVETLDQSL